ncbi:hypothetical protein NDU88_005349 [Pleurodeles waltl]|uniref:Uncharacterized protein n=1 Tax=Pleurodeles waltl TaxID=8319 RepID=A0AAV7PMD8_PLEWA|nr:hypothetical protein NDU88_005349 [Pleurodeles waltl]
MATPQPNKNDNSIKDLYTKPVQKKTTHMEDISHPLLSQMEGTPSSPSGEDDPVTRHFLDSLFETLQADIEAFQQEMAADIKEVKCKVGELGQKVDALEQSSDTREEELYSYWRELLELWDQNFDLDLGNHLTRSNIRIRQITGTWQNVPAHLFTF